ncbi:hypothetical protein Dimus_034005 [Dionaea muscipula]
MVYGMLPGVEEHNSSRRDGEQLRAVELGDGQLGCHPHWRCWIKPKKVVAEEVLDWSLGKVYGGWKRDLSPGLNYGNVMIGGISRRISTP